MSRSERLLDLLQLLRRHRRPVTGRALAEELGISIRSLYRDIASLQAQGAPLEGEAGMGYVLRPGFTLPPLMFDHEEIEALALGSMWVAAQGDPDLARAARNALAKIGAVLPVSLYEELDDPPLLTGPRKSAADSIDLGIVRRAIRQQKKITIVYRDETGMATTRMIWPFALGFFDHVRIVVAWCELRVAFRHFRSDRIVELAETGDRYPRRRQVLLKAWREDQNIRRRA
ncbi:MAG: helix-turn-helix transcriptional regulator [Phyllobacterium sp.]